MKYAKITGTGSYLPKQVFTNADWEKRVNTSDAWIVERTGIKSRHIASENETATMMGANAALNALNMANVNAKDIQLVIVATGTPDKIFPATACLIQKQLQIPTCIAFDIQAACSGFVYALSIADQYIKSGVIKRALIIGTEVMSRLIDWQDRNTCVLFGDGAGACVLEASDSPGILSTHLYADGNYNDILYVDMPSGKEPCYIHMQGQKVFKLAVAKLGELVKDTLQFHNIKSEDIDWLVPHQANIRIIKATADKLKLPMEKVICTVEAHSNTSSASIPLALDIGIRDGRIKKGQTLLLEAIGGGMTWGSALVKY
ncbi:MAG: ketoacyl-ACP synthase III [Proteobacteria bacterium]|nr:ketoacyl-ACP synthase III [Pseudomonadota bacterium]